MDAIEMLEAIRKELSDVVVVRDTAIRREAWKAVSLANMEIIELTHMVDEATDLVVAVDVMAA